MDLAENETLLRNGRVEFVIPNPGFDLPCGHTVVVLDGPQPWPGTTRSSWFGCCLGCGERYALSGFQPVRVASVAEMQAALIVTQSSLETLYNSLPASLEEVEREESILAAYRRVQPYLPQIDYMSTEGVADDLVIIRG